MTRDPKYIDEGDLGELIDASRNRAVLSYLSQNQLSCHSDVADMLFRSTEKCGEWLAFSPSFRQLKYVALVTNRTAFALGIGQRSICYRLPEILRTIAFSTGATEAREIGTNWVRFELFRVDWPTPDLPFWTLRAYVATREDK
jgi:hypothetical protein